MPQDYFNFNRFLLFFMIFISVFSFQFLFFVLRFLGYIVICTSHAVACGRDAQPEHTLDRPPQVAFEENQSQVPQNGLEWQVVRGQMSENERGKRGRQSRRAFNILRGVMRCHFKRRSSHAARRRYPMPFNTLSLRSSLGLENRKESVAK